MVDPAHEWGVLVAKMLQGDGVVSASPSYAFQVSGTAKTFIARPAFYCHRPRFFGKSSTSIVTQGLPFDTKVVAYLSLVGSALGFKGVPGTRITVLDPMTERESHWVDELLKKHSGRFRASLFGPPRPPSSLLMGFRIGRSMMKLVLDGRSHDYRYYKERGWFDSDYFYPPRPGSVKKVLGREFDRVGNMMARRRRTVGFLARRIIARMRSPLVALGDTRLASGLGAAHLWTRGDRGDRAGLFAVTGGSPSSLGSVPRSSWDPNPVRRLEGLERPSDRHRRDYDVSTQAHFGYSGTWPGPLA